jgi:hypothetical protein
MTSSVLTISNHLGGTSMTKTKTLRRENKDHSIRFIESRNGTQFMLVGRQHMVRVDNNGIAPNGKQSLRTYFSYSLPWAVVRRIFTNTKMSGSIRDGWPYRHTLGQNPHVTIGCQTFAGYHYDMLRDWALGRGR